MKIVLLLIGFAVLALSKSVSEPSYTNNKLIQDTPAGETPSAPSVTSAEVKAAY